MIVRNSYVTSYATMTAILAELGFISNINNVNKLKSDSCTDKMATKTTKSVAEFFI